LVDRSRPQFRRRQGPTDAGGSFDFAAIPAAFFIEGAVNEASSLPLSMHVRRPADP
jgi:hypothetical protein